MVDGVGDNSEVCLKLGGGVGEGFIKESQLNLL